MLGIHFIWNFCIGFKPIDSDLSTRREGQFCRCWALKGMQEFKFLKGSHVIYPHSSLPSLKVPLLSGADFKALARVENSFFSEILLFLQLGPEPHLQCMSSGWRNMGFLKCFQRVPYPPLFTPCFISLIDHLSNKLVAHSKSHSASALIVISLALLNPTRHYTS